MRIFLRPTDARRIAPDRVCFAGLPSAATWDDVMYRVYVRQAVEAGRDDAAAGRLIDVEEVRRRFRLPE